MLLTQCSSDWITAVCTMQEWKDSSASSDVNLWGAKGHLTAVPVLCAILLCQPCCNPAFFFPAAQPPVAAEQNVTAHGHVTQLVTLSAFVSVSQLAEKGPFPQRDNPSISKSLSPLIPCRHVSGLLSPGLNSCPLFLSLYCRILTCGASEE